MITAMSIWLLFLLFAIGLLLVVKGGDLFVDAASWIARAFGIPSFIIGATIVSIATTMPEMIVSLMATANGKVEIAIGNAVGSVTANTAMIMALAMLFMTIKINRREHAVQFAMLIATASVLLISSQGGSLSVVGSIILVLIFAAFMYHNIRSAKGVSSEQKKEPVKRRDFIINIIKFIIGAAAIVGGSQLLITYGPEIAKFFGVSDTIIAVTMFAIGTSIPELVTTITAIVKKESSLSIGNIVGANIIDLSLILPLCSLVSGKALPVDAVSAGVNMPVCLGVTVLALVPMFLMKKATKWQGALLLAVYCVYLAITII